jgi:hypothetical protein
MFVVRSDEELAAVEQANCEWGSEFDKIDLIWGVSDIGWMTRVIFRQMLPRLGAQIRTVVPIEQRVIIFLDCASSHIDYLAMERCAEWNISCYFLPARATGRIQVPDTHMFCTMQKGHRAGTSTYIDNELKGNILNHKLNMPVVLPLQDHPCSRFLYLCYVASSLFI